MRAYNNGKIKRVQERTAYKHYLNGGNVYVLPCNLNPLNPFIVPARVNLNTVKVWKEYIMYCTFYECTSNETGHYPAYYIDVDLTDK